MKVLNQMNTWLRGLMLVMASVLLLSACGNPTKSDLMAIGKVMADTGYTPAINEQYQKRLQTAKNEAEAKAIVEEMLAIFEKVPPALNTLSLKTEEGKTIRDDLSQGMAQVLQGTKQAMTLSPSDTAGAMEAQKLIMTGQQQMMKGQNAFMVAAGREGLENGKDK